MFPSQKYPLTDHVQMVYQLYFGFNVQNLDKIWSPSCCHQICSERIYVWLPRPALFEAEEFAHYWLYKAYKHCNKRIYREYCVTTYRDLYSKKI